MAVQDQTKAVMEVSAGTADACVVDITLANLSVLKTGRARAIRFSTLDRLCRALDCQPGDVIEYRHEETQKQ